MREPLCLPVLIAYLFVSLIDLSCYYWVNGALGECLLLRLYHVTLHECHVIETLYTFAVSLSGAFRFTTTLIPYLKRCIIWYLPFTLSGGLGGIRTHAPKDQSSLITMHPGVDNTCEIIRQRYYWPRMRDEVELYVKSCVTCGGCKQPHHYLETPFDT